MHDFNRGYRDRIAGKLCDDAASNAWLHGYETAERDLELEAERKLSEETRALESEEMDRHFRAHPHG